MDEFSDVFDDSKITPMKGDPMVIHLDREAANYKPLRVMTARPVPLHFKDSAKATLDELIENGVLERVTKPTEWVSPGFFVRKPNGKARLVTDYSAINRFIRRPIHPFSCPLDIVRGIKPKSKFFLKLDAVWGYFQIRLSEESADLTTFLLPEGRFRYLAAPMGLNPSGDEFCFKTDYAFEGLDIEKIVDDILLQAETLEEIYRLLYAVLLRCREHNLTLSRGKLEVGTSVKFAGYLIGADGIRPDPEKIRALSDFPAPHDVTSLRSFLGLANQLGMFVPDMSHMSDSLRPLLRKNAVFIWDPEHQRAFQKMKDLLTSPLVVGPFDPSLETELLTDASRLKGFGFALVQRTPTSLRLVQCGSRSLTSPETRYATIELECLAVQWAMKSCRHYLLGLKRFKVLTDHKPLVGIFAKHLSDLHNDRLLRFREKLSQYTFDVVWVPGKTHFVADALSRAPVFSPPEIDPLAPDDTLASLMVSAVVASEDPFIRDLIADAVQDADYIQLVIALTSAKDFSALPTPHPARAYRNVWGELSIFQKHLVLLGNRLVIPSNARRRILKLLHVSHCGILRTRKLAQSLYFWPGMNSDIKSMIEACAQCQMYRPSQAAEPLQMFPEAPAPMTHVSSDLFQVGAAHYLVLVDRYSGYPFVARLTSLSTSTVTGRLLRGSTTMVFRTLLFLITARSFVGNSMTSAHCMAFSIRSPLHITPKVTGWQKHVLNQ